MPPLSPDPRDRPQGAQHALRISVLATAALILLGILVFRLWSLQVLASESYEAVAADQQTRRIGLPAERGRILDSRGRVLVRNRPGLQVVVDPSRLATPDQRWPVLRRLGRILERTPANLEKRIAERQKLFPFEPVVIARDVDESLVGLLKESAAEFPGVRIEPVPLRYYPYRQMASHIFGGLREIGPKDLANPDFRCFLPGRCYEPGDIIGSRGLEGAYDRYLRGRDGTLVVPVDAAGNPTGIAVPRPAATAGYDLRLTVDLDVQRWAEDALAEGIRRGEGEGAEAGAIVAIDPRDGAVRAMASWPSFDPNWFISSDKRAFQDDIRWTINDRRAPALNRAIEGLYPPASLFKPMVAIAGAESEVVSASDILRCTGAATYYRNTWANWDPEVDTDMDLATALERSCDTFFYEIGVRIFKLPDQFGNPIQRVARRFGYGSRTGIDIAGENAGLLPTPAYKRERFPIGSWDYDWHPGDSINLSIGQGDMLATPLQMAVSYAAIANGGRVVTPHIAQRIERGGVPIRGIGSTPRGSARIKPAVLAEIRDGLYNVTHGIDGTAYKAFKGMPIEVLGKTGTAETPRGDDAEFVGFAPAKDPEIVIAMVIEKGGHGGAVAAPAAAGFFCDYFHLEDRCPEIPDLVVDDSR